MLHLFRACFFSKWISNVMNVSINKQLISCQNFFGVLSRICKGKCHKTFSDPNVSAGNITLCGVQYTARELRFERSCFRAHPSSSLEAVSFEGTSIFIARGCFIWGHIHLSHWRLFHLRAHPSSSLEAVSFEGTSIFLTGGCFIWGHIHLLHWRLFHLRAHPSSSLEAVSFGAHPARAWIYEFTFF